MSNIPEFIKAQGAVNRINELSTDGITLLSFLALVVDIKYRARYGHSLEWDSGKGYTKDMKKLPDQLTSVDAALEVVRQRELSDEIR